MQVVVEMASSSETLQQAADAGSEGDDKLPLAPPPAPPPIPLQLPDPLPRAASEGVEQHPPRFPRNGFQGKRRNSFHVGFKHPAPVKRRRRVNSDCDPVLPSNFLLGGNIFDPLNLNSLLDEDVNRTLNAETPKSSPLPSRSRDPVEILIPKDITDPLSLNTGFGDVELLLSPLKSGRKRHRHRHHPSTDGPAKAPAVPTQEPVQEAEPVPEELRPYELNTAINCRDEVVPLPALESERLDGSAAPTSGACVSRHRKRRRTSSKSEGRQGSPEKGKSLASVVSRPHSGPMASKLQCSGFQSVGKSKPKDRFQFGNYCRYYGYRNPTQSEDTRLRAFRPEWFRGKAVLDIGCNVGHLTLCVAQKLGPSRIVGMDIDGSLIRSARQNIRHYLSEPLKRGFPAALAATRGPIAAPSLPPEVGKENEDERHAFPHNVVFVQGNYVVDRDELVEAQKPEYDVILCLSVTKWVHLNWGDDGLKRLFKRIYRHLTPGGILVLEPQSWSSYGKRKKLTESIYKNYCKISLKPDQFTSYLVSSEVGFSSYEVLAAPCSSSKGFQRSIYAFHKPGTREQSPAAHHSSTSMQG
ncbi:7SK snRNA methylphosphate capping enzyme [Pseudophryne corroboree]|uniref:7SK snRNA methylphosphate capping enzyme n=1 Tax=Pseudophryne corroboree TaxID=495146 RepID=UPI00308179FD